MSDTQARVHKIVATMFHVPEDSLNTESSNKTIPGWDSMGHLALVLELEQEFGISIEPEAMEAMTSVSAIARLIDPMIS